MWAKSARSIRDVSSEPAYVLQRRTARRRSLGSDIEWRLLHHGHIRVTGTSTGRLFLHGAEFTHADGRGAFTIAPTRRVVPKTWIAVGPDSRELVTLNLSSLKRGQTSVTDHIGGRTFTLQSVDSVLADTAKAAALLGTERFSVCDETNVVAEIGGHRGGEPRVIDTTKALLNALRARSRPFSIAETLTIVDPAWEPSDILACICLAFRNEVISFVRSP